MATLYMEISVSVHVPFMPILGDPLFTLETTTRLLMENQRYIQRSVFKNIQQKTRKDI